MAKLANLGATADAILDAFVKQLKAQGVSLPDRQYRAPGQAIVWDGEQLTVALMGIHQGQPGVQIAYAVPGPAVAFTVDYSVNLVRSVSALQDGIGDTGVPDASEMDSDGGTSMGDASALIAAATAISTQDSQTQGSAFGVSFPGESFMVGPLQTVGPEGGLQANRLLLSLSAD